MDNKSKKINDWFDSGEYKTDIDKLRTEIMSDSANSNSEATTASIFEKELYYLIVTFKWLFSDKFVIFK